MAPIEVERRFVVTEDLRTILSSLGTERTHQHSFQDAYFDTLNFSLLLNDHWLRRRNTCWELKYPLRSPSGSSASATTQNHEATTDEEIIPRLSEVLNVTSCTTSKDSNSGVQRFVESHNLVPYACFTTHRQSMKYGDFTIDIDNTDFGYSVMEVEVMVESTEQVQEAVKKIEGLASKLGITLQEKVAPKVTEHLKRHNKEVFTKLISQECNLGV